MVRGHLTETDSGKSQEEMREEHGGNRWTRRKTIPGGGNHRCKVWRRARAAIFEEAVGRPVQLEQSSGNLTDDSKRGPMRGLVGPTGAALTLAFIQMKRGTFRGWAKEVLALTFFFKICLVWGEN